MAFRWLPDPDRYAHPRLSWAIMWSADVGLRLGFRQVREVAPALDPPPGTLVVSNHLRDWDVPILATLLCRREGLRLHGVLPFSAMREDLLRRDALARLLCAWPRPLARLAGCIGLGWFFRAVRAAPMRRLREFSVDDTLQALHDAGLGASDPATLFNARGRREVGAQLGSLPPRLDAIRPRRLGALQFAPWGLRRLQLSALRMLDPAFRATVAAQLDHFAALLASGSSVYFAPEGAISLDGRFSRIRTGTARLCRLDTARAVLPCALSYDALGPGRVRVVVRVGALRHDLDPADRRRFAARLREAILGLYAVNPSHLIAWFLYCGPKRFTSGDFSDWLRRASAAVAAAGFALDPLLQRDGTPALAATRLRWLHRHRLLARDGAHWHNRWPCDTAPGWHAPAAVVRTMACSFADTCPALAGVLCR
jgi:1-acyl-sn-glycerol-3-phosphate acyltransferase